MTDRRGFVQLAAALAVALWTGHASAQDAAPKPRVLASAVRQGAFHREALSYDVAVTAFPVTGEGGARGSIVVTSYERRGRVAPGPRPVIVAFNGGPGASSSPLHLSALGPRRYQIDADGERVMTDNPFSPLDAADLVFVDPLGTGFSRPDDPAEGRAFWSVTADAASVVSAIRQWRQVRGRERDPLFLCGESYGTSRAAAILDAHPDLVFDGVLLLSVTGGPDDADDALARLVPTYAVTAAFHGLTSPKDVAPQAIFDEALAWALRDYLPALRQGEALTAERRARVAADLASRIGLPADAILAADLRLDKDAFMRSLLAARGRRTGQLDARATGALAEFAGKTPPYDDPSMPGARPFKRPTPHLYFTEELGVRSDDRYVPLNLDVNAQWRFDRPEALQDPLRLVAGAMQHAPRLRLFWVGGLYDLTTPLANGRFLMERAGIPTSRTTILAAPTGHMPYEGDEALARFTEAVIRFVLLRR